MKEDFLKVYKNPGNNGSLSLKDVFLRNDDEIMSGAVICVETGETFKVENGVFHLILDADMTQQRLIDQSNICESDIRIDQQLLDGTLPDDIIKSSDRYREETASRTDFLFNALTYKDCHNKNILEIGCGPCELIGKFSNLGFNSFALDFAPTCFSNSKFKNAFGSSKYFERVLALMNRLPFQDHSFDIVFMHASLHHATPLKEEEFEWFNPNNIYDTLMEVKRVLRPDGIYIVSGEGVYPENFPHEERKLEQEAMINGCYESHYTKSEYLSQFKKVGLYPTIFANAIDGDLYVELFSRDGVSHELIKPSDRLCNQNLYFFPTVADKNISSDVLNNLFPDWVQINKNVKPTRTIQSSVNYHLFEHDHKYIATGFSGVEHFGRWTDSAVASIVLNENLPRHFTLTLDCMAFGPNSGKPLSIKCGSKVNTIIPSHEMTSYSIRFSDIELSNEITFEVPCPTSPKQLNLNEDTRRLGIGVSTLTIKPN